MSRAGVIWAGLGGLCLCAVAAFWIPFAPNLFAHVPSEREPRLVGTWQGKDQYNYRPKTLLLKKDGTGFCGVFNDETIPRNPVEWGTVDGELHLKYRSSGEGWVYEVHRFTLTEDGSAVVFARGSIHLAVAPTMRRLSAERAPSSK